LKKQKKIILIEDDNSLLNIAEHQLNTTGYNVSSFTSGEEAIQNIEKNNADLILSDLILEGTLNGNDILKHMQQQSIKTPFILMTANGTIESAVECVKLGAWNYLTKPFQWLDMLDQIDKAIQFNQLKEENTHLKQVVAS
jgi:DNA-binding NtrC family response regulator